MMRKRSFLKIMNFIVQSLKHESANLTLTKQGNVDLYNMTS